MAGLDREAFACELAPRDYGLTEAMANQHLAAEMRMKLAGHRTNEVHETRGLRSINLRRAS